MKNLATSYYSSNMQQVEEMPPKQSGNFITSSPLRDVSNASKLKKSPSANNASITLSDKKEIRRTCNLFLLITILAFYGYIWLYILLA